MATHRTTSVDAHVGQRLRQLRVLHGISMQRLGAGLGLTYQQIQKYEKGNSRISAARLYEVARFFGVPIGYFFEGLRGPQDAPDEGESVNTRRETLELARSYHRIGDRRAQRRIYELMKAVAAIDATGAE